MVEKLRMLISLHVLSPWSVYFRWVRVIFYILIATEKCSSTTVLLIQQFYSYVRSKHALETNSGSLFLFICHLHRHLNFGWTELWIRHTHDFIFFFFSYYYILWFTIFIGGATWGFVFWNERLLWTSHDADKAPSNKKKIHCKKHGLCHRTSNLQFLHYFHCLTQIISNHPRK